MIIISKWWHRRLLDPFLLKFICMKMLEVFHKKMKLMQVYADEIKNVISLDDYERNW